MKVETDSFSLRKVYPSRGRLFVRSGDGKVYRFNSHKTEQLFLQRKNPRKIAWTVYFRRMHKKGISEEVAKKRSRKTIKHQRGVVGLSLADIQAKRNQKPEVRNAARDAAKAKSKEEKKARAEARKEAKKAGGAGAGPAKVSKQQMKGAAGGPGKNFKS